MGPARARLLTKVIWAGASRWCGFGGWGSPGRCYCRTPALLWGGGSWLDGGWPMGGVGYGDLGWGDVSAEAGVGAVRVFCRVPDEARRSGAIVRRQPLKSPAFTMATWAGRCVWRRRRRAGAGFGDGARLGGVIAGRRLCCGGWLLAWWRVAEGGVGAGDLGWGDVSAEAGVGAVRVWGRVPDGSVGDGDLGRAMYLRKLGLGRVPDGARPSGVIARRRLF
jgi:hypothetical protein